MRIGVLTRPFISEVNFEVLNSLFGDEHFNICLAIVDSKRALSIKKKILKNLKKGRGGYIFIMMIQSFLSKNEKRHAIKDICYSRGIDIIETNDPYSNDFLSEVQKYNLDILILINGFGIIKKGLLNITPGGILSYHHGNMRKYRGMPPAFWELYNNEKEIGVTVQKLDEGLDCGIPITEKTFQIQKDDTLQSLRKRIYIESVDMMKTALQKLSVSNAAFTKIDTLGKIYSLPNLRQWIILNFKLALRCIKNIFNNLNSKMY